MECIGVILLRRDIADLKDKLLSDPDNEELKDTLFEKIKELEDNGYEDVQ